MRAASGLLPGVCCWVSVLLCLQGAAEDCAASAPPLLLVWLLFAAEPAVWPEQLAWICYEFLAVGLCLVSPPWSRLDSESVQGQEEKRKKSVLWWV